MLNLAGEQVKPGSPPLGETLHTNANNSTVQRLLVSPKNVTWHSQSPVLIFNGHNVPLRPLDKKSVGILSQKKGQKEQQYGVDKRPACFTREALFPLLSNYGPYWDNNYSIFAHLCLVLFQVTCPQWEQLPVPSALRLWSWWRPRARAAERGLHALPGAHSWFFLHPSAAGTQIWGWAGSSVAKPTSLCLPHSFFF